MLERYGSPLFILDALSIDRQAEALLAAFPPPRYRLYYSIKANPLVGLVQRLLRYGIGCDACGLGDVEVALAAGCSPAEISVTGVGFSRRELLKLIEAGVWLNLDSVEELHRLCEVAPHRPIGLRIATGVAAGFPPHCRSGLGGKLGIAPEELPKALGLAHAAGVAVENLHTHLGSSIEGPEPFVEALEILLRLAEAIPTVTTLNLGGGLGIPYIPETPTFPLARLERSLGERLDRFERETGRSLTLSLEPGEFIVGPAGHLATTVRVVKDSSVYRPRVAIIDATANLMPAALLYGTMYPFTVSRGKANDRTRELDEWAVYGRTNQGGELLAAGRMELAEGDVLVFSLVGAYTSGRASRFNEIPRPAEVMVDRGEIQLLRRAEDHRTFLEGQEGFDEDRQGSTPTRLRSAHQLRFRIEPSPRSAGSYHFDYTVDGEEHEFDVGFRAPDVTLDDQELQVVGSTFAVVVAQLVLAGEFRFEDFLPRGLASGLRPLLSLLYDIRSYCDGRERAPEPRIVCDERERSPLDRGAPTDGTLVAISGGFDSSLLLKLATLSGAERVEAIHFNVNEPVREHEERAAKAMARACGVELHIVDIATPGFVDLGRRYSRSFGRPYRYNEIPHGRDLLLAPLAALVARRRGLGRVAFGFDRESFVERIDYQGATIHRNDVASRRGFELMNRFIYDQLDPAITLEAPLSAVSGYRIRGLVFDRFPELLDDIQTCYWSRQCERCIKCATTFLLREENGREAPSFLGDILNDPRNLSLSRLFESEAGSSNPPYWELLLYLLERMATVEDENRHWVERFRRDLPAHQRVQLARASQLCHAAETGRLIERFGTDVRDLFDPMKRTV